ncbi:endospore germination permease [Paenibacillus sp. MMS20-IR301]|uniref:GerAB/ArcD/ProY family transporter n=1 Tax=Paenibacillus sp. MMS20-IR301 TaxID=2895946 RepID=UPI0028E200F1|nr:endospore germination permease [Paenibacillus sp. MMS20-IR301]WNS41687.1 endospore germination permease [Paenibacillus sp. MMS20-IR301]
MSKEIIPAGQSISIVVLFISGSSLFMGTSGESGNSSWIALIFAIALAVPLMLIYARLHVLFPGKDLFEMLIEVFGGVAGRVLSCLYIWYALHLGALVLRNFGEFSKTVALTSTPMIAPMLVIGLLCIWVVIAGLEVLGRSAKFLLLFSLIVIVVIQLLSIPRYEYHHLKPLLGGGWGPIFADTAGAFTFPFAEIVVFLGAFNGLPAKGSAKRVMLSGMLIAGGIIIIVTIRNILVLGPDILSSLYFPSYVAVSRINIGDFLSRIEGSAAIVFVTALFIKVSLCLYVTCNGLSKVLGLKSYRSVVLQTGLIMVYLSDFIYTNIMQMQEFAYHIYKVYALPFEVFIPVTLWIIAELLARRAGRRQAASNQQQP